MNTGKNIIINILNEVGAEISDKDLPKEEARKLFQSRCADEIIAAMNKYG